MDFDAFSSFLMGDGPLPEDQETIDFDNFSSFSNEQMFESLQKQSYSSFSAASSEPLRKEQVTQPYHTFECESDGEDDEGNETDDEIAEAEAIDAEFPDGEAYDFVDPPPLDRNQKDAVRANAELQEMIERTENVLEQLSMQAHVHIERQPLSTQILLANMANEQVFKPYEQHGSQAQFSASVMKFLTGGDTIRRPGKAGLNKAKDGKLKFAPIDPFAEDDDAGRKKKRAQLKRKAGEEIISGTDSPGGAERIKLTVVKRGDKLISVMKSPAQQPDAFQGTFGLSQRLQTNGKADGNNDDALTFRKTSGPIRWEDLQKAYATLESDQSWSENSNKDPAEALANFNGASNLALSTTHGDTPRQPMTFTPLADSFSKFQLQTPTSRLFHEQQFAQSLLPAAPSLPTYCCSVEPRANAELALQPYNPISVDLVWPKDDPMPSIEYLEHVDRILHLYNAEARVMLSYFVRKYDTPFELGGGGPGGGGALRMGGQAKNEPPHALFRLGIAQYLTCKAEQIVEDKEADELGLTPEARSILRSVWNEHQSIWTHFEDNFLEDEASDDEDEDMIVEEEDDDEDLDVTWVTDTPDGADVRPAKKRFTHNEPDPKHVAGGLNPMEKKLLSRACNISVETIDAYWDLMRDKTKAWAAVQLWCRARNMERVARVKAEGRW